MALGGACGRVSWSMGELLARVAQPQDEAGWIELAKNRTVRQMRVLVLGAMGDEGAVSGVVFKAHAAAVPAAVAASARAASARAASARAASARAASARAASARAASALASASEDTAGDASEEMCTLTCTVDREQGWLFEATRALLWQLGEHSVDAQIAGLLAEGQGTLLAGLPRGALDIDCVGLGRHGR